MSDELIARAEAHAYQQLFVHDLHWSAPDHPPIAYRSDDGVTLTATNVSSYKGLRVWVCDQMPGSHVEAALDRLIAATSTDRLVIFHDGHEQVWRWPVRRNRDNATTSRLTSHRHHIGAQNPKFAARLEAIRLPTDTILDANAVLAKVRSAFDIETQNETRHASKLMARMYTAVEKSYPNDFDPATRDHEISATLARILFLMFGDDTDMWRADTFRNLIHHGTASDGSDIGTRLNALFAHLDTPPKADTVDADSLPYVNGGIFQERITLPTLSKEFRDTILEACAVDWSTISPAIFGSMFQSVRDVRTRRELGEHYTSEENILKTLNPLFLDELRAEFDRAATMKDERRSLTALWKRLGDVRFMDPACGCGNFIIVAYRELRDIELRIMERLQVLSGRTQLSFDPTLSLRVTLDHFSGIEVDEWPARIAETAMFLIDRQCDLKLKDRFGEAPQRLPIQRQARIVVANALRLDWADVCAPSANVVIAGNPPFLGHKTRSASQTRDLRDVWNKDDISRLDFVTGWHAKTIDYLGAHEARWAYVATSSITQGDPVPHLFGPIFEAGWAIKFAHRTFPWTSEAAGKAAVHCVIVGFARNLQGPRRLFDHIGAGDQSEIRAATINAYLVDGPNVMVAKRSPPLSNQLPPATFGNMARDDQNLIVEPEDYDTVVEDPIAAKYLRPYLGSEELLHSKPRWCLWLTKATATDLAQSPVLANRVQAVRAFRLKSSAASTRQMADTAHLFGQRPALYQSPYVIIPRHISELYVYFPVRHVDGDVIASDATFTAADPDGYLFALISSAMFIVWQRTVGGRLESRLRFSNTIVWNNLPLPPVEPSLRAQIVEAGRNIAAARDLQSGRTLAELYNSAATMPAELVQSHRALDVLVDHAFGATRDGLSEQERQRLLFSRYHELTSPLFAARRPK